jgi:hypothetical protein
MRLYLSPHIVSTTLSTKPKPLAFDTIVHWVLPNLILVRKPKEKPSQPLKRLIQLHMRGRQFSEDLRWVIVRAKYHGLDATEISALTGISERQIRRIRGCYDHTGDVRTVHAQWGTETRGRDNMITMDHRRVRYIILVTDAFANCGQVHRVLSCKKLLHLPWRASEWALRSI